MIIDTEYIQQIKSKRARIILQHILDNGSISSQEIQNKYGYNHPPRAIRDIKDCGINIITNKIKNADGKIHAIYQLGDIQIFQINNQGRTNLN